MFFKGSFTLTETGDTYFDMSKYSRGIVYVNGHNLGRYWNDGATTKIVLPCRLVKKGE